MFGSRGRPTKWAPILTRGPRLAEPRAWHRKQSRCFRQWAPTRALRCLPRQTSCHPSPSLGTTGEGYPPDEARRKLKRRIEAKGFEESDQRNLQLPGRPILIPDQCAHPADPPLVVCCLAVSTSEPCTPWHGVRSLKKFTTLCAIMRIIFSSSPVFVLEVEIRHCALLLC